MQLSTLVRRVCIYTQIGLSFGYTSVHPSHQLLQIFASLAKKFRDCNLLQIFASLAKKFRDCNWVLIVTGVSRWLCTPWSSCSDLLKPGIWAMIDNSKVTYVTSNVTRVQISCYTLLHQHQRHKGTNLTSQGKGNRSKVVLNLYQQNCDRLNEAKHQRQF